MPGLVVFRRRWSVGSDDLVVPGAFLFTTHITWTIILAVILFILKFDKSVHCILLIWSLVVGYLAILLVSIVIEVAVCVVALRGSILDTTPRSSMQYILYIRLAVMIVEAGWLTAGVLWIVYYYTECPIDNAKEVVLAMVVFNSCILLSVVITVWCCYDTAGRSWVKMKQYQRSMRESELKFQYKRSGSTRNWRQRKVLRAYQDSWQNRCQFIFCCSAPSDRNRNSFADIARLLSDFFRDLDVVPSDVVVGLVLLRKFQKIERKAIIEERKNDTYEFLSGVPITPRTQFLSLQENGPDAEMFQTVIHFANFAVKAYGWPVYVMMNKMGICQVCTGLSCYCCLPCRRTNSENVQIVDDNCCRCNYAALEKLTKIGDIEIIYATYHVDVGETPFFVALDYDRKKIVISIRGTLSMKDILTDLNAESETIPLHPPREDWTGHKGMVQAAQYIYEKIEEEQLLQKARARNPEKGTKDFDITIVGHSLGAGTASILGILLRQNHSSLECFCYSPPGGLLSAPAVEYTKEFTISVVVGKDVVPRIGLHQMETLRTDLINAIKRSVDPKWKTITCSIICCGCSEPTSAVEMSSQKTEVSEYMRTKKDARCTGLHPSDSTIALTSHQPLYPPGRIIHVVRDHPKKGQQSFSKKPVYQALWANNTDFDEVLISPVMIQDHMPDKVLEALNKVVTLLDARKRQQLRLSNPPLSNISNQITLQETSFPPTTYFNDSNGSSASDYRFCTTKRHESPTIFQPIPSLSRRISFGSSKSQFSEQQMIVNKLEEPRSISRSILLNIMPKLELNHDEWSELAPLASPESMSEISSISSRTSVTSLTAEMLKTPKVMRRTPKIIGSLSTCADDIRNIRNFATAKKIPVLNVAIITDTSAENSSNSNTSFESALSKNKDSIEEVKAENIVDRDFFGFSYSDGRISSGSDFHSAEDILDIVLSDAGCKEFFNSDPNILEMHNELMREFSSITDYSDSPSRTISTQYSLPGPSQDMDPDLVTNLAIDLAANIEPVPIQMNRSKVTTLDQECAYRTPDTPKNVTFNPEVVTVDTDNEVYYKRPFRWRFFKAEKHKKPDLSISPVPSTSSDISKVVVPVKTILSKGKKPLDVRNDEPCTSESISRKALPILNILNSSAGERTSSPSFVRRKKYVYPSNVVVISKPLQESAV
ncbi:diacylglycerol lipase-alpha isoform X2 [Anthonomus grandis grandis]|uniref:diacylglycerol lipase-alpha isoform X2 n=1 Tax=Anthonomus grandis grandis TaxID=2921223 RepID=UPI00216658F2|nr:diacylglycerol lipase-alpha isoform X2 [Anthonomus grandis grandis]